jgi:hypothetical protein
MKSEKVSHFFPSSESVNCIGAEDDNVEEG